MKKYKTSKWDETIEEVEIVKESESCIWVNTERFGKPRLDRHLKDSAYCIYHDTWEKAYNYLLGRSKDKILAAKNRLKMAEQALVEAQALRQNAERRE